MNRSQKTILNADVSFCFYGLISQGLCLCATSHTKLPRKQHQVLQPTPSCTPHSTYSTVSIAWLSKTYWSRLMAEADIFETRWMGLVGRMSKISNSSVFWGFQFLNLGLGASWIQTMRDGMIFWIREHLLLLLLGCCWVAVGLHSWANFEDAWRQHPATILALASVLKTWSFYIIWCVFLIYNFDVCAIEATFSQGTARWCEGLGRK